MEAATAFRSLQQRRLLRKSLGLPMDMPLLIEPTYMDFARGGLLPILNAHSLPIPVLTQIRAARPKARHLVDCWINQAKQAAAAADSSDANAAATAPERAAGSTVSDENTDSGSGVGGCSEALEELVYKLSQYREADSVKRLNQLDQRLGLLLRDREDLMQFQAMQAVSGQHGMCVRRVSAGISICSSALPEDVAGAAAGVGAELEAVEANVAAVTEQLRKELQRLQPVLMEVGMVVADRLARLPDPLDGGGGDSAYSGGDADADADADRPAAAGALPGARYAATEPGQQEPERGPEVQVEVEGAGQAGGTGGAVEAAYGGELRPLAATASVPSPPPPPLPLPPLTAAHSPDGGGGGPGGVRSGRALSDDMCAGGRDVSEAVDDAQSPQERARQQQQPQQPQACDQEGQGQLARRQQHEREAELRLRERRAEVERRSQRTELEARAARLQCTLWWCMGSALLRVFEERNPVDETEGLRQRPLLRCLRQLSREVQGKLRRARDVAERGACAAAAVTAAEAAAEAQEIDLDGGTLHELRSSAAAHLERVLKMSDVSVCLLEDTRLVTYLPELKAPPPPPTLSLPPPPSSRSAAAAASKGPAKEPARAYQPTPPHWLRLVEAAAARAHMEAVITAYVYEELYAAPAEVRAEVAVAQSNEGRRATGEAGGGRVCSERAETLQRVLRERSAEARARESEQVAVLSGDLFASGVLQQAAADSAHRRCAMARAQLQGSTIAEADAQLLRYLTGMAAHCTAAAAACGTRRGAGMRGSRAGCAGGGGGRGGGGGGLTVWEGEWVTDPRWWQEFADLSWDMASWGFGTVVSGSEAVLQPTAAGRGRGRGGDGGGYGDGGDGDGCGGGSGGGGGGGGGRTQERHVRLLRALQRELRDMRIAMQALRPVVCVGALSAAVALRQLLSATAIPSSKLAIQPTALLGPGRRRRAAAGTASDPASDPASASDLDLDAAVDSLVGSVVATVTDIVPSTDDSKAPGGAEQPDPHELPPGAESCILLSIPGAISHPIREPPARVPIPWDATVGGLAEAMASKLTATHGCILMCASAKEVETVLLAISKVRQQRLSRRLADLVFIVQPLQKRDQSIRVDGISMSLDDVTEAGVGKVALLVFEVAALDPAGRSVMLHPQLQDSA